MQYVYYYYTNENKNFQQNFAIFYKIAIYDVIIKAQSKGKEVIKCKK